ncbi:hypothetical protein Hdeb2414_s0021g00577761 [Helianthus debilis subsp. tardiflorus]
MRAGPAQGVVNEPVHETVADDDEEVPVEPTDHLETRRKTRADKPEKKEKRVEGKTAGTPRKRPSTLPVLDYVVVSDTFSGLGTGEKPRGSDPDDRSTLTEMMRRKALGDKKWKLDEQAAALLASKKAKLQKEATPAPSESNIDMGIFSGDRGNLLEEIYAASAPTGKAFVVSGKGSCRIDVNVEHVGEGGSDVAGDDGAGGGGDDKGKGVNTEMESSENTPHHTIYTKRPSGGGGGATSGVARSPQFENIRVDSWDTHNPACDDLPHAPHWNLTQGSRMNDLDNCHDFFSLSLPPAERMFQKTRNRFDLLDDHVRVGVNCFATSQEIVREWRLMGEETLSLKMRRERLLKRRKNLMLRKKVCSGGFQMLSKSLRKRNKSTSKSKKIGRLLKVSECEAAERLLEEKVLECKASELLVEEIVDRIVKSHELASYMFELGQAGYNSGRKDGYSEGRAAVVNNEKEYHFEFYKQDCGGKYAAKRKEFASLEFAVVKAA